ncbi:hypothetical protein FQA39_LY16981 [Lamprigera yunnana]|nr:hypothetical protein FQA39_LY16981 [Lamprigera yunnana]
MDHTYCKRKTKRCCVPNCKDFVSKRHWFPKSNISVFKQWINNVNKSVLEGLTVIEIYKSYYVCENHFSIDVIIPGTLRGLNLNAVPTLHLPNGSSRHLDFSDACQYSSKQSLLKPGTYLDYVTDIILSKLFYIIPQVCTSHNIKKVLINIISKDSALFLPLKCDLHDLSSFVLEQLTVCIIYFWIKQVNLLLSGKNRKFVELVNSNDTANLDPIKLLAHKYYFFSDTLLEIQNHYHRLHSRTSVTARTVTMLPGGGTGPELMEHVKKVFEHLEAPVKFEEININPVNFSPKDMLSILESIKKNGVAIKGNVETCSSEGVLVSKNAEIRKKLGLYVFVFHCCAQPNIKCKHPNLDVVVVRYNTEAEYSLLEHEVVPGVTESLKIMVRTDCEKVARYAFEYAKNNDRRKITTVHKANIMKLTDGMFLEVARNVSKEFPQILHEDLIVDNCCMQIVSKPSQFDVLLVNNLYGSIVGNLLCGLIGGSGLLHGTNYGECVSLGNVYEIMLTRYWKAVVFESATRNTGTQLAGQNIANPIAMLNAAAALLSCLQLTDQSNMLREAITRTMCQGCLTPGTSFIITLI